MDPSRREFVTTASGLALAAWYVNGVDVLGKDTPKTKKPAENLYERYAKEKVPSRVASGYGVTTNQDIEGPFYRANAPVTSDLASKTEKGKRLCVQGFVVRGPECTPLVGAVVDVWQATSQGRYDNDDPRRPPRRGSFRLRGRIKTDAKGRYAFKTIWPGHYKIGPKRWRPAHLHVKVSAPGYESLTTQLYFADDPYNANDPWFSANRALRPKQAKDGVYVAKYELVLTPKPTPKAKTKPPASRPTKK